MISDDTEPPRCVWSSANPSVTRLTLSTPVRMLTPVKVGFDVLHLHEPLTPVLCTAALAMAQSPVVGTYHAAGDIRWNAIARPVWGFLTERLDHRIAVSEQARESIARWFPGDYDVIPNGV